MRLDRFRLAALLRLPIIATMLACAACATTMPEPEDEAGLKPELVARAVQEATALRASGRKVWCVPFARNASGIDIKGNAGTWWKQAEGEFARTHEPKVGAVMAFSATRKLPLGHVAVVSSIESDRMIRVDHANWVSSKVSLGMAVMDVSPENDWSVVKVESRPDSFGRDYPVDGFILPAAAGEEVTTAAVSP